MFLITDENDVIQDIASEKVNLSRGYKFANFKVHENINLAAGATVGDSYKDGLFFIDINRQAAEQLAAERESLINEKTREVAISLLKQEGKLPPAFEVKI